jgi:hypothetical protein
MGRRDKLSRDQKRKQKLAKEGKRERILPYEGQKYRGPEFNDALMDAETGILQAFVLSNRQLTDRQVEKSLEYLILELRGQKPGPPPAHHLLVEVGDNQKDDLVAHQIKSNWRILFAQRPGHSKSDLTGILRTILSSIKVRSHPGPDSQGYLYFIEKFLGNLGVDVREARAETLPPEVLEAAEGQPMIHQDLEDKERKI